jgi:glucan-binding YG repeat protein
LHFTTKNVQAATTGFRTVNGKTYYYDSNGKKHTGWLKLNGKRYYFYSNGVMATGWLTSSTGKKRYFNTKYGYMATGWMKNSAGQKRYFNTSTGYMVTGWVKNSTGSYRYFNPSTGYMTTGWLTNSTGKRYFDPSTGYMTTGWLTDSNGDKRFFSTGSGYMFVGWVTYSTGAKRYFNAKTGVMSTGWLKSSSGNYRYFNTKNGFMATGWVTDGSQKRYFYPSTGYMATGTVTIDEQDYEFNSNGVLIRVIADSQTTQPTSAKTIKNYLAGALQPVGQALYVWGGGWTDSTLKGVSSTWKEFYDSQSSSYNYNNYKDLSSSTRSKGLDCSGFVGWAAYQVMQSKSGVGSGYTVVSGEVGSSYVSRGWGSIITQSALSSSNWTLKAGDVGYNDGHTWIVLGQCSDKSIVIVHSTPNAGCQISGTPTPSGNYSSEAIALAKKYMSRYSGYTKYSYNTSSGNYVRNGNYLRWNSSTLSDPDGYLSMSADEILADLFK